MPLRPETLSAANPGPEDFALIFGPAFWGFCLALILSGVTTLQGYLYFTRYNDKLPVKAVAIMMLVLDFISMALILQSIYYYMLPDFGSLAPLAKVTAELNLECLIAAIITFTSQMYFAVQLYYVKTNGKIAWITTVATVVFGFFALVGGVGCVALMFMHPQNVLMNRNPTFGIFAGVNKGFAAATDIIATVAMCIFLKSADTGMTRTSGLLNRLMIFVINRGVLVTIAQILLLVFFFAYPTHLYWFAIHVNTTKLYVNTFFAMLNGRNSLKEKSMSNVPVSVDSSYFGSSNNGRRMNSNYPQVVSIGNPDEKNGDIEFADLSPMSANYAVDAIRVTKTTNVSDI